MFNAAFLTSLSLVSIKSFLIVDTWIRTALIFNLVLWKTVWIAWHMATSVYKLYIDALI